MNNNWNELSMRDKAAFIRMGVANGYKDIDSIRQVYNEFRGGGKKKSPITNRKQTFLKDLEQSLRNNSRYNTAQWKKYLTDLAQSESSFTPDSVNSIGAKGYFQLMPANRSKTWNTPTQQFEELYKLNDSNLEYFERNMTERDYKKAQELGIDIYGLMAGAHLGGAKNVMRVLRGQSNAKDANNTSVLGYMKKFSQTDTNRYRTPIDIEMPQYPVEYPDNLRVSPIPTQEQYMIDNNSPTSYNSPLLQGVSDNEITSNAKIVDEINNILANRNAEEDDYLLDTKDSSDLDAMTNDIIQNSIPQFNTPYIQDNAQYKEPTYYTATDILRAQAQKEQKTLLNDNFENTIYDGIFAKGGNVETPLEYTHRRFPITEQFDVHPYLDATFTPRDIGDFGDIEYMTAEHNTLPYYNNYSKPDSLLNKSVIVYNDKLGENTNEAVALDALSHGLREQDDTWKNKYIPTLLTAFQEDANYYADKYNVPNRQEFIDSYVDGKIRARMVEDKYREALNYPSRNELIEEYYNNTPQQQNALTEAYSYINPIQLPEVTVLGKKHKFGGNLFQDGGDENSINYEYRGTIFDDDLKNQGITHIAELPEIVVKGRDYTKPYKSVFEYDPNFAKELPYFLPVVGDALDVADIARDTYNGDYLNAGIGAGLFVLPNFIEKPLKKIGRKAYQLLTAPTRKAAEKGRSTLLEAIPSSWNRERWNIAAPYENTDAIINDLEQRARTVPFNYSKTSDKLKGNGETVSRPALVYYKDGKKVDDYYNSGLDVYIASDIGKRAYTTGIHELIHYLTGNSHGLPKVGIPKFGSLFEPIEINYNAIKETTIPPSTLYQHGMVDYNDSLLPKINRNSKAVIEGDDYALDKQENQTWLKTWFLSDIKPHLKNPNDANEIENFLNEHPELIKNNDYVNTLMKDTRPGTNKDYSKALSRMLYSTLATAGLLNTVKE